MWNVGVLIYFMLIGKVPFRGLTINQIMQSIE